MKKIKTISPKNPSPKKNGKHSPKNSYDAVSGANGDPGGGNKRRQAIVELSEETGETGILRPYDRLKSLNLCRDVERNFSVAKSMMNQVKANVVGWLAKIQVNTEDDFGKEATDWFNQEWFSNCDFRADRDFSKLCRMVVAAKKREGDLLVYFDDGNTLNTIPGGTGKLAFWESDQIADCDGRKIPKGFTQEDGVILDAYGREVGYITGPRGSVKIDTGKEMIFTRDPNDESKNSVKLIRSGFRLNQHRGTSEMLSAVTDLLDCYEMRKKELQSAKVAASLAGTIKRTEAETDFDNPELDPTNENPTDVQNSANTLPEEQTKPANYERMEALTGGYIDYLAPGDEFVLHDIKRPNVNANAFIDTVMMAAGSSMGLAKTYALMRADTSYTAFRGEMVMTWVTWYQDQKDLEREFLDWVAERAIRWAIKKGLIKSAIPPGWENKISWHLPRMPYVNEGAERDANAKALKNGESTFSDLIGPNWREVFDALSVQLAYAREKNLPLSVFEAKSGGGAPGQDTGNNNQNQNQNGAQQP